MNVISMLNNKCIVHIVNRDAIKQLSDIIKSSSKHVGILDQCGPNRGAEGHCEKPKAKFSCLRMATSSEQTVDTLPG